jgi:hypothetical protein
MARRGDEEAIDPRELRNALLDGLRLAARHTGVRP